MADSLLLYSTHDWILFQDFEHGFTMRSLSFQPDFARDFEAFPKSLRTNDFLKLIGR